MAVIVTDMIMPASCAMCIFGHRIDNNHTMCLRDPIGIPNPDMNGRPSHCPLKEVESINKKQSAIYDEINSGIICDMEPRKKFCD